MHIIALHETSGLVNLTLTFFRNKACTITYVRQAYCERSIIHPCIYLTSYSFIKGGRLRLPPLVISIILTLLSLFFFSVAFYPSYISLSDTQCHVLSCYLIFANSQAIPSLNPLSVFKYSFSSFSEGKPIFKESDTQFNLSDFYE